MRPLKEILEINLEALQDHQQALKAEGKPYKHLTQDINILALKLWSCEAVDNKEEFLMPEFHDSAFTLVLNPKRSSFFMVADNFRKRATPAMLKDMLEHSFFESRLAV